MDVHYLEGVKHVTLRLHGMIIIVRYQLESILFTLGFDPKREDPTFSSPNHKCLHRLMALYEPLLFNKLE